LRIVAREVIEDVRGESRWPPALTLLVAIVVPLLLPDRYQPGAEVVPHLTGTSLRSADSGDFAAASRR
jgi:hypothetical protein